MTNPVEPSSAGFITDALNSGDYAYGFGMPVFKVFEAPEPDAAPAAAAPPGEPAAADTPFAPQSPASPALPPLPDGVISSPSLDLSFLTQPAHMPMPSPKLAEASQPQPGSAISPPGPSSPDVHPTEMPATPVSPQVAEAEVGEANSLAAASPVTAEPPAPSSIETPPAPVAAPPGPVAGEPNVAVGQLPTGAAAPASAVGTPPAHPEPEVPAVAGMQVQMSQNLAEQMASVLADVLRGKAP